MAVSTSEVSSPEESTSERWHHITEILDAALALEPGERSGYLTTACTDDPSLFGEIEALLELEGDEASFLDTPAFSVHASDPRIGRRIGPYEIQRRLGHGGMASVYLAVRQDEFRHKVALKLIKGGMDDDETIRRFRTERQILARLEHPHIAHIVDGGTTDDGLPYFAMEYVEGEPIDHYCEGHGLSLRRRLELFCRVASAVAFSHQNLIVHRDLKPGNVLVTQGGVPKLLDFGIAKLLQPTLASQAMVTTTGTPMTLHYASPEQVRGQFVTTQSDVYSLGVLLYKLLAGRHPYASAGVEPAEIVQGICEKEPAKPSAMAERAEHRRRLRGDLDSIVLKAMRKELRYRYESADQLAADIHRHLGGLPVRARKGTLSYRTGKLVRRNKLGIAALMLVIAFSVNTTVLWNRAVRERDQAERVSEELFLAHCDSAELLYDLKKYKEAKNRIQEALAIYSEMRLPVDDTTTARLLSNIGTFEMREGNYDEAEEYYRQGLARRIEVYGTEHEHVATSRYLLGVLYRNMGNFEHAEALLRDALRTRREILGNENLEVATVMTSLGKALRATGRLDEAVALYREALAIRTELSDENDSLVVKTKSYLAELERLAPKRQAGEGATTKGLGIAGATPRPSRSDSTASSRDPGRFP